MILRMAALAALLATPAVAQSNCAATADAERQLRDRHGEIIVAYGMMSSGGLLQIWANPNTGTWTAIVTDGTISCLVADGTDFAAVAPRPNL